MAALDQPLLQVAAQEDDAHELRAAPEPWESAARPETGRGPAKSFRPPVARRT
jgi:hypothetical protein